MRAIYPLHQYIVITRVVVIHAFVSLTLEWCKQYAAKRSSLQLRNNSLQPIH